MIRILSNNQWRNDNNLPDWIKMGLDCSAEVREKGFAKLYLELLPDVMGLQEVSPKMLEELLVNLNDAGKNYAMVYGKDTPILFDNDKLELVFSNFGIYPESIPNHEGSFNNERSKSWSLAVFRIKETGKIFAFMSTHLWWMSGDKKSPIYQAFSDEAREFQLGLVLTYLQEIGKKYNCPIVLVGDLNTDYNSLAIKKAKDLGYFHAHDMATDFADETQGYHWCGDDGFTEMQNGGFVKAIDHILVKNIDKGAVKTFKRYTPDYYMPLSDHSPVYIDVEF